MVSPSTKLSDTARMAERLVRSTKGYGNEPPGWKLNERNEASTIRTAYRRRIVTAVRQEAYQIVSEKTECLARGNAVGLIKSDNRPSNLLK